ncbi:MAG: pilus assembly PilX N-terminal domain-containing protein [Syntrophomonadaceae bacterium]|nr:pilus assembly PilX N-terminal domain-containing protein [Syntrophomonadaceae bacterium]
MKKSVRSNSGKGIADENGQIIILALVIFLLLTIIEGAALSVSFTERKMSGNNVYLKQAQLAADSGLEWAAGAVYNHLLSYGNPELLPSYDGKKVVLEEEQVSFELKGGTAELFTIDNYLVYSIGSIGICAQAKREVTARIRYDFTEISGEGSEKEYSKGYIIYYEIAGNY